MNEDTFPVLALAAIAFILVMGITFGSVMYYNLSAEANNTGTTTKSIQAVSTTNMWVIAIVAIILVMIIIIGFQKFKGT